MFRYYYYYYFFKSKFGGSVFSIKFLKYYHDLTMFLYKSINFESFKGMFYLENNVGVVEIEVLSSPVLGLLQNLLRSLILFLAYLVLKSF